MKKPARRPVFSCWIPGLLGGRSGSLCRRSSVGSGRFGSGCLGSGRFGGRRFSSRRRRFSGGRFSGSSSFFLVAASGQGSSQQGSQENGIFHLISL
jgi:hypothetical protein